MKKGWKVFWIVCIVIACIGLGLCVAGVILGFNTKELIRTFEHESYYVEKAIRSSDSNESLRGTTEEMDGEDLQSFEHVAKLDIDINAGELIVKTYQGDAVKCNFQGIQNMSSYEVNQDGDELNVEVKMKKNRIISNGDGGKIVLYVPENLELKEFSLDVGAGDVRIGNVLADQIDLQCGAGRIEYSTTYEEDDYNYEVECGVGEVTIGSKQYSGIGTEKSIENHSERNMDISCGIGEVIIKFK